MIEDQIQTPGPQLSTPPGMEPAPKKNKTLLTCGIIAVVLLCIGVIIAVLAFGGLTLFSGGQANVDVNVTTSGPVSMGQPFDLKVSLTNAGSKAATVTGVKLSSQLLSLAAVTGVNPTSSPRMRAMEKRMRSIWSSSPAQAGMWSLRSSRSRQAP